MRASRREAGSIFVECDRDFMKRLSRAVFLRLHRAIVGFPAEAKDGLTNTLDLNCWR